MEDVPKQTDQEKVLEEFLKNYEARETDIQSIAEKLETLIDSGLLDDETLSGLKIATFDSGNLYVFSREPHESTNEFVVIDLGEKTRNGFHCYKIASTSLGADIGGYRGAGAWLTLPEIENTAKEPVLVPNPMVLEPKAKNQISKVVFLSPEGAYNEAQKGSYDYLTDLLIHETGHIEEMSCRDWPNEGEITPFADEQSHKQFIETIQSASIVPEWLRVELVARIDRGTIGEMYAMLVDGEAKKHFRSEIYEQNEGAFAAKVGEMKKDETEPLLDSTHHRGYILARILEMQIPDYQERKKFVQGVLRGAKNEQSPS